MSRRIDVQWIRIIKVVLESTSRSINRNIGMKLEKFMTSEDVTLGSTLYVKLHSHLLPLIEHLAKNNMVR
jgi:hypothetical protein